MPTKLNIVEIPHHLNQSDINGTPRIGAKMNFALPEDVCNDHRIQVERTPGRQARLRAVRFVPKYRGRTVIFCRSIMLGVRTLLLSMQQTPTAGRFIELELQPVIRERDAFGEDFISILSTPAELHKNTLKDKEWSLLIVLRACSPDPNPIENLWNQPKGRTPQVNSGNAGQLIQVALYKWENLSQEKIDNLIKRQKKVTQILIKY